MKIKPVLLFIAPIMILLMAVPSLGEVERVPLKVFFRVDTVAKDIASKANQAVLRAFNDKYPYIDVTSGTGIQLDMDTGPLMAVAGGTSPDIVYVNMRKSGSYIEQGIIQPLDEFVEKMPADEIAERFPPVLKQTVYRRGLDEKKHYYAIPYGTAVRALYYRKDLFKAAGLNPDNPPRDWDELLEYAQKITNPDKRVYGIGIFAGAGLAWEWYSFLAAAGGDVMVENDKGEWTLKYNSEAAVRSAYFYTRLLQQKIKRDEKTINGAAYMDTELYQKWQRGEIGMFITYIDERMISAINPFLTGVAPVPGPVKGQIGSELNSTMMGLYSGVTDPKVKDAAFKLMWFWKSPEAERIRTRVFIENGYGGFVNPSYLRKFGYTEYLKYVPKGWEATLNSALEHGKPEPYGKNCDAIYTVMSRPIDQMLADNVGNMPKEAALKRIRFLLNKSVREAQESMLGEIPVEKMMIRRTVATFAAMIVVAAFLLVFRYLMKVFTPAKDERRGSWEFRKYWLAYLLLIPAAGSIFLWQYIPLFRGAAIAFYDYRIVGGSSVIWLDNFADVLFDTFFWQSLRSTLYYAGLWITFGFTAPIALAIFLSEVPRFKVFFRVLFYLPAVISGIVVMFMWKSFYDPSAAGLFNSLLSIFGIEPMAWLQDPKLAMLCVIVPIVWASMGPGCLIYLAALKSVPEELYEAAELDGSGTLRKIWNITLPTIKPLLIISFIGSVVMAFNSADFILVMTGGGPNNATRVLGLEVFYNAFLYLKFGRAAAIGWLMGLILLGFTAYQMKRLSNMTFKAGK